MGLRLGARPSLFVVSAKVSSPRSADSFEDENVMSRERSPLTGLSSFEVEHGRVLELWATLRRRSWIE
jgi:hypothetical protein